MSQGGGSWFQGWRPAGRVPRCASAALITAVALAVSSLGAAAQSGGRSANQASEVGVSSSTIRIAVVADVDNPFQPGLFQGARTAVEAFATYVNSHGGLAGRKLVVDFIDSHLSDNDARNAVIKACSQDLALVGTAALFLNNVDDMVTCKDQSGAATGIPDIPVIATELAEQCSSVTFPVNPPELDCATLNNHPQTYRVNVGTVRYLSRTTGQRLHGIFLYDNDLKSAAATQLALVRGAEAGGVVSDGEIGVSASAPQPAYTPIVQRLKSKDANYALNTGPYSNSVALRKEAALQGLDSRSIAWDCFSNCYDQRLIQQGGAAVDGQYVTLAALPFNEAKHNRALSNYVNGAGRTKVDGFGEYAWIASLLFRDSVNAIVKRAGSNGLTRRALLAQLRSTTNFDAEGMYAPTNFGQRIPSPCFMVVQVKNAQFVRVYPSRPSTFDCNPRNRTVIKADLLGGG